MKRPCTCCQPGDWFVRDYGDPTDKFVPGSSIGAITAGTDGDGWDLLAIQVAQVDGSWYIKTNSRVPGAGWQGPFVARRSAFTDGPFQTRREALLSGMNLMAVAVANSGADLAKMHWTVLRGRILEELGPVPIQQDLFEVAA